MKRTFRFSFGSKPAPEDPHIRQLLDEAMADAVASPDGEGSASFSAAIDPQTGERVPLDDPRVRELLERAQADAATSPDGAGMATDARSFSIEIADGKVRTTRGADVTEHDAPDTPGEAIRMIGGMLLGGSAGYEDASRHTGQADDPQKAREREMWERLHLIAEGKGAYPDTQRWHKRLSTATTVIAIALPLTVLVLTLATGQTMQTIFYATFGAAIVAMMFRGSIR